MSEVGASFNIGEVVWAKITGYPWWPAQVFHRTTTADIELSSKQEYSVMFFGDNSHAYLPASKLTPYQCKHQLFGPKTQSKKFKEAVASANHFTKTREGSLLEKEILIDSHPISLSFDKSTTTLAHEQKLVRLEELEAVEESSHASGKCNSQQNIILDQLTEEDINSINQLNVLELLEAGVLGSIRQGNYSEEIVASVEEKLKMELLNRYSLGEIIREEELVVERISQKPIAYATKKLEKKKRSIKQALPQSTDFINRRLCILKLYECLKSSAIERAKAMSTSVQVVEKLLGFFDFASIEFKTSFKRLLQILNLHISFGEGVSSRCIDQKLEEFLEQIEGAGEEHLSDQKSKATQYTAHSDSK